MRTCLSPEDMKENIMIGNLKKMILIMLLCAPVLAASCGGGGAGAATGTSVSAGTVADTADQTETTTDNNEIETGETIETADTAPAETDATEETVVADTDQPDGETADDAPGVEPAPAEPAEDERAAFSLVVLPDTQHTTVDFPYIFYEQMQWILDNREAENIAFVLHEGDITHYNNEVGWENASTGFMSLDDAAMPYAIAVGNHDMEDMFAHDTTSFNAYFPLSRFSNLETFGGSFPEGAMDNSYHLFSAGGTDWLVLSIIYLPTQDDLDWAAGVVEAHPDRRVIVVTHAFVQPDNTIGPDAQNLWNNFLSQHANITLVFNGHYTDGQYGQLQAAGDNGNTVYGMFANYQKSQYGGAGYMRLVTLDPAAQTVSVKTYSPWEDAYKTDGGNEFVLTGVDLSPPAQ